MTPATTSPLRTPTEWQGTTTPAPSPKGDTADQFWLKVEDRIFWRRLVPTLILLLATVIAVAFYITHQDWITIVRLPIWMSTEQPQPASATFRGE